MKNFISWINRFTILKRVSSSSHNLVKRLLRQIFKVTIQITGCSRLGELMVTPKGLKRYVRFNFPRYTVQLFPKGVRGSVPLYKSRI